MIMRFRGGGVGHMSTRAATDFFKNDRDILDMESCQARREQYAPPNVEERDNDSDIYMNTDSEGSEAGEAVIEDDDEVSASESELVDYGYELDDEHQEIWGSQI
jgi:hypothetical protein